MKGDVSVMLLLVYMYIQVMGTLIRTIVILNIPYLNNIPAFIHIYAHCYYGILKYKVDAYET